MKIEFGKWTALLQRTIQDNNWRDLHPKLRFGNDKLRDLKDQLDYIYHVMYLQGKWNRENLNDQLLVSHVKDNLNYYAPVSTALSMLFCKLGKPTPYDLKNVLELFIRQQSLNLPLDPDSIQMDYDLMEFLANSFKRYTDTSADNKKFNTLDKAFGVAKYQGQHNVKSENPYRLPSRIKRICKEVIDLGITVEKAIEFGRHGTGHVKKAYIFNDHSVVKKEWQSFKWIALNDYLYRITLSNNKGTTTLTDSQISKIKRNWKVDMPKELKVYMKSGIPRMKVTNIEVIKGK